jgi:hypothetical protein
MVVGVRVPILAKTIIEEIVTYIERIKVSTYEEWKKGHNVFIIYNQPLKAISKEFALKLSWPRDSLEDMYAYLRLRELSLRMIRRKKAAVFIRNANSLKDYINERRTLFTGIKNTIKYFSADLVKREFKYPKYILLKYYFRSIFERPLLVIGYLYIKIVVSYALKRKKEFSPLYDPNNSTKNLSRV